MSGSLLVKDVVSDLDAHVVPWMPILAAIEDRESVRAGAYLVGHFDTAPDRVDLSGEGILYIGETHGWSQSLGSRVSAFARSLGLVPGGAFFHSAGERFAQCCPGVPASAVSVALVPFTGEARHPADARGIVPQLIEKLLLAKYLDAHHRLPVLNEDGRYTPRGVDVSFGDAALADCLAGGMTATNTPAAGGWLRNVMDSAYKIRSINRIERYKPWIGLECCLSKGWTAYLGSADVPAPHLDFTVWSPADPLNPWYETRIATGEDARRAAWEFYAKWNYGV